MKDEATDRHRWTQTLKSQRKAMKSNSNENQLKATNTKNSKMPGYPFRNGLRIEMRPGLTSSDDLFDLPESIP
jgi:hypothetical protein